MINGLLKKLIVPILGLSLGTATLSSCAPEPKRGHSPEPKETPTITANTPDYTAEKGAITNCANRLLTVQDINGSYDWIITGHTGPSGKTYLNIAGVTAEGVLNAYKNSGNTDYLTSATKTGDYLNNQIGNPVDISKTANPFNILYLYNLYKESGLNKYKEEADAIMNNTLNGDNYWAHHNGNHANDDGIIGCSAQELLEATKDYRGATSTTKGIVPWDLYKYVESGKNFGEDSFANDMANLLKQYVEQLGYVDGIDYYTLGLSGAITAMKGAGLDYSIALDKLKLKQSADGSFEDSVQSTAYAVMALTAVGETNLAKKGIDYLFTKTNSNGGVTETDGEEYAEVNSEFIQALFDYINY